METPAPVSVGSNASRVPHLPPFLATPASWGHPSPTPAAAANPLALALLPAPANSPLWTVGSRLRETRANPREQRRGTTRRYRRQRVAGGIDVEEKRAKQSRDKLQQQQQQQQPVGKLFPYLERQGERGTRARANEKVSDTGREHSRWRESFSRCFSRGCIGRGGGLQPGLEGLCTG
ncbi:hypothetical protein K0M31_018667 [Melipona bicolor]|uniref:Uncharacterized protein n=1 Tax=Melipona bicolor TaxID=60889 RepID=A0AA40KRW2_9HYME|nr:hypothetical protein K0M31_018667 [Melipona bicolor]